MGKINGVGDWGWVDIGSFHFKKFDAQRLFTNICSNHMLEQGLPLNDHCHPSHGGEEPSQ